MRPRASLQAARCRFSTSSSPESCLKSRPHRQGLRHCRDTGRPEAVGRSSPVTRPRTRHAERATRAPARALRAPQTPQPPQPPHSPTQHPLAAQRRPHAPYARRAITPPLVARVCAGAQSCTLTSTRVEGGAWRQRGGGGTAHTGPEGAPAPGAWPGVHLRARGGASKAAGPEPEKQPLAPQTRRHRVRVS